MRVPCLLISILFAVATACGGEPIDPHALLRGSEFVRALDQPLSIDREKVAVRELLERLQDERRVAIVLDRRIDPGRTIDARLPAMSFRSAVESIARRADAVARVVGDTLIVGPENNTGQLRTICVLRGLELDAFGDALGGRRFQLARTHTFAWDDLERPTDLVQRIAAQFDLQVAGLELVPHDLWAHGMIIEMTPTEALSWVLAQYDLTFEWTDVGKGVRIIPLSGVVAVTREHPIRRITALEALQRVNERFPELETRVDGKTLIATGLVEQHDVIAVLARGDDPDATPRTVKFGPLEKRRFTLRVVRQPASAVFATLQKREVDIRIDEVALIAVNVDLEQKISLDIKQATISELLEAICEPLGATFAVDGETVHVPAPP
jgi:hypothetical protein